MPRPSVLVVEDDTSIRKLLTLALAREGYVCAEAGSVSSALERLQGVKPDLVILDVNLPGGTGFDVLRALRERYAAPELPVVMLSALSQEVNVSRGLQLGAQDYLVKPFRMNDLKRCLARVLPTAAAGTGPAH
jgi:DNA-binding response OmpR family regulator